ncbi:MAG: N-6 DNA methylase, partial [Wenzhouxiangella sp.]
HEMLGLYGEGISRMPENPGIPPLFRDIFKNAYLPYRDPETLKAFLKIIDDQDQELELLKDDYRSPIPRKFQWRTWAADPEGITGDELLGFINDELFPKLKNLPPRSPRAKTVRDVFEDAYNFMKSGQLMRQVVNKINGIDFNNLSERQHFGDIYEKILSDLQSAGNAGEYYTPRAVTRFMVDMLDPQLGQSILDPACGTGGFLLAAHDYIVKHHPHMTKDERKALKGETFQGCELVQSTARLCAMNLMLHGIGGNGSRLPLVVGDSLAGDPGDRYE